ncbi:alpha/beta hydrolase [Streptacidiphilus sp. P02-A3a]|nr:alpha/beta hydrolase [Streptacidiphilus sp. P02-A3a]
MTDSTPIPVVFIHGLWMHATSWDNWVELFNRQGYEAIAPGWPGDAPTAEETRVNAAAVANRGITEVTDHYAEIIRSLPAPPVVVGHSFGGLIAQKLLADGLARGGVAIAPAQFRGVKRLPLVQLRTAWPVLGHPGTRTQAVSQTADQFHHGFANGVSREESDDLYRRYAIPAPALPVFQGASANLSPSTEATVDVQRARGPLLIIAGDADRTVPEATVHSAFKLYRDNPSITAYQVFEGRGHSQQLDHGWPDVAQYALDFLAAQGLSAHPTIRHAER